MWSPKWGRAIILSAIAGFAFYLGLTIIGKLGEERQRLNKIEEVQTREQSRAGGSESSKSGLPSFKGFSFTEYGEGGQHFTVRAESFKIRNKKVRFFRTAMFKEAVMEKARVDFYQDEELVSSIRGQRAVLDLVRMSALFTGQVTVRARGGKFLECEKLLWSRKAGAIKVVGPFVYREGEMVVKGNGLYADSYLTRVNFLNRNEEGGERGR